MKSRPPEPIKKTSISLLADARRLSSRVPHQISTALPTIIDPNSLEEIHSWRRNGKNEDHVIHQMMPRVGGFPPSLARYFIAAYSRPRDVVFDPYCGKGTVVFEAMKMARVALGGDVAPDAVMATRAKCAPVSLTQVANYIQNLRIDDCETVQGVPTNVRLFYHPATLREILSVRGQLLSDLRSRSIRTRHAATFVCGVMLGLLHGHSRCSLSLPCNQCFAMSPNYVRRYVEKHGLKRPRRDVRQCLMDKVMLTFPIPKSNSVPKVYQASADRCSQYLKLSKGSVALVITSPPYLNRQTYSKDSWLRLWFLGYDHREIAKQSLETGSIAVFVDAMVRSLEAIMSCVQPGGRLVLVGGRARTTVAGATEFVRVTDLCLLALDRMTPECSGRFHVESVIRDSKVMNRGSYFAVHAGKPQSGGSGPRLGEEDILIVRKGA